MTANSHSFEDHKRRTETFALETRKQPGNVRERAAELFKV